MVLSGGCGGPVRRVWWTCEEGVVVLSGGCGGPVRRVWWSCQKGVMVLQEGCGVTCSLGWDTHMQVCIYSDSPICGSFIKIFLPEVPTVRPCPPRCCEDGATRWPPAAQR